MVLWCLLEHRALSSVHDTRGLTLRGGGNKRQRHEKGQTSLLGDLPGRLRFPQSMAAEMVLVPDCVDAALAEALQTELVAHNFSLLTNDCAQAFRLALPTDNSWMSCNGSAPSTALTRLTQAIASTLQHALAKEPPKKRRSSREQDTAQLADGKHESCNSTKPAHAGELGQIEVIVMRKNCFRLCNRGGDFFGRRPTTHKVCRADLHAGVVYTRCLPPVCTCQGLPSCGGRAGHRRMNFSAGSHVRRSSKQTPGVTQTQTQTGGRWPGTSGCTHPT